MILSAITIYTSDPNLLTALLASLLGVLLVALCLMIGMYALRSSAEKNKMSMDEYHFEKREDKGPKQGNRQSRHGKKNKQQEKPAGIDNKK